MSIENQITLS